MKTIPITSIMTKDVVCVTPNQKILDVKHIYEKEKFHHHIPVTDKGKLVGMISLIDFMYEIKGAGLDDNAPVYNELTVKDIMTLNPYFLESDVTLEQVARELAKGQIHAIPIVEADQVVGIVSTADVIQYFLTNEND